MFRNKEYVLAVLSEQSFTKAAQKLFVSQPSLSATIKRIEDKIGSPIFDRSNSPITLTEVGKQYAESAMAVKQIENNFSAFLSDSQKLLRGKIKIGGSSLFSSFVLPELISQFKNQYPKIEFEIFEDNTKNLMSKLNRGELDIVIDNVGKNDENFLTSVYKRETMLLTVPRNFSVNERLKSYRLTADDVKNDMHLSPKKGVDLSAFSNQPFILLNPENDTGKRAESLLKKYYVSYNVLFNLEQQLTAYNACCTGLGITFVSDTLIKKTDSSPDVYYYKIQDESASRNIRFYYKKNHYLSRASQQFIALNSNADKV